MEGRGIYMKDLKLLRFKKDLSLRELSELVGIPATNLWRYETGKIVPDFYSYKKLMKFYGYEVKTTKKVN